MKKNAVNGKNFQFSEVEQDAIEHLKKLLSDFDNEDISETDLWVINNLIEKQRKEIEEYKSIVDCIEEFKRLKRPVMELVHEMNKFEDEFISKDKIREKIKEVSNGIYDAEGILKKLLEEN